ncbi:hypothetical protein KVO79_24635 [Serratia quinivorans]|uniref:hypothetical protein n=1 Tax=Serratia quinivorans TaxID=137545 RepID=UPI001C45567E|nr:hypothetical protein [Serratia quinivorans]MBV6695284.1 hypothetical protein [Serratia quinivorans]
MSNIYQFPQGKERQRFKSVVKKARNGRKRVKASSTLLSWINSGWFYGRFTLAFVMTTVTLFVINLLYSFRKLLTFLTVMLGLILYYTVYDNHLYKGTDFTLLFCIGAVILAQAGLGLNFFMLRYKPFFKLLGVCDKGSSELKNASDTAPNQHD